MIKTIIKILSVIFLLLIIIVFYLSFFGIKTKKFNNQIISNVLKINKKINLSLDQVNYLLNPYNLTINIKTKNPQISLSGTELRIKDINTLQTGIFMYKYTFKPLTSQFRKIFKLNSNNHALIPDPPHI